MNNQSPISNHQTNSNNQIPVTKRFGYWLLKFGICLVIVSWLLMIAISASAITGNDIINKVDQNMTFKTAYFESKMLIHIDSEVREKRLVSQAQGKDKSFAEFTYPARDKGVKYLKIEDQMWMYLPSVDKTIKIAGHMLRQSMMGSDFSYEDALESGKLLEKYNVKLVSEDKAAYALDLTAKVKEVAYYQRKLWVDKKLFVPLKEELFAKSGKKLKAMTMTDIQKFEGRYYPRKIIMKNLLRKGSYTEMIIMTAEFDVPIPASAFTQANLKK